MVDDDKPVHEVPQEETKAIPVFVEVVGYFGCNATHYVKDFIREVDGNRLWINNIISDISTNYVVSKRSSKVAFPSYWRVIDKGV